MLRDHPWEVWVTSAPDQWLIESTREAVRIGDPRPGDPLEATCARWAERRLVATLLRFLDGAGIPYRLLRPDDPLLPHAAQSRSARMG